MIVRCTCSHKEQDKVNGKGKRVANKHDKKAEGASRFKDAYECTVCGKLHYV